MMNESKTNVSSTTPIKDPNRPADNHTLYESKVSEKSARWEWKGLHRRWIPWCPAWILWCLLATIVSLVLGMTLGFQLRVRDFKVPTADERDMPSAIHLSATLVDVDAVAKTMTIHWGVVAQVACCEDYDIFFDQNLLVSDSSTTFSNSIPEKPVFSIHGALYNSTERGARYANIPFFPTKLFLTVGADQFQMRTLQAYPFDHYSAGVRIFAKIKRDGFNISDLAPVSIMVAGGIAAGFNTKFVPNSFNNAAVAVGIDISRGLMVRSYCVVIVVAIWLVTLTLLSATVCSVFLGRKMAKEVMVIPVATLFAFTQLRGSLPGAPSGFGAIVDFIGVLPCLAILSLCSVLLLAVFLFRDPEMDWKDKGSRV